LVGRRFADRIHMVNESFGDGAASAVGHVSVTDDADDLGELVYRWVTCGDVIILGQFVKSAIRTIAAPPGREP
jgi:hypothetical protein